MEHEQARFWQSPVRTEQEAQRIIAALSGHEARTIVRGPASEHPTWPVELMRDRLLEAFAHRIHRVFCATWQGDPGADLPVEYQPAITGNGGQAITLADPFRGWPHPTMTAFHECTKAGMLLGHVDLELAAVWVLRDRLGHQDTPRFSQVIDPSNPEALADTIFTPEHRARNQAFELSSRTPLAHPSHPARPRF